jgi:VWFA-related protein
MFRTLRMTAIGLIALCGLGGAAFAQNTAQNTTQDNPSGRFQGKVNVNEVLLDVLVTDAKGNVIVGLDKGDFVVKEGGRPVDLTGVTFYSNRSLVDSSAPAKANVSAAQGTEDRYFILFFEDQKVNAQDAPQLLSQQLEAAKRARGWVDGEMLVNDWVAVVSYDTRLKVQQDFTHDRKALIAAIGDAMKGKDREGNYPSRIDASRGPSLLAGLPKGDELGKKTPKIYDALQALARSAGNIRGRKNLLLFTYGLPSYDTTTFGQFVPDKRYFLPTVQALNANNVAVYSLDLTPAAVEHRLSDSLNKISDDTGGRYFFNVTNFSTSLDQISKENNGYYLLSYQSDQPAGKSGFQNVTVTTTNPEFRVKARKGYEYGK